MSESLEKWSKGQEDIRDKALEIDDSEAFQVKFEVPSSDDEEQFPGYYEEQSPGYCEEQSPVYYEEQFPELYTYAYTYICFGFQMNEKFKIYLYFYLCHLLYKK